MRILLITDGIYPFVMGGMQKHSYYLAKFLGRKCEHVHVVHCMPSGRPGSEFDLPEFADFSKDTVSFQAMPFPVEGWLPGHYLRANRLYSEQIRLSVQERLGEFDLIYCQGLTGLAFVREKRVRGLPVPLVANLHGYEMFQAPPSIKARLQRGALRHMAREITLGSDAVFSFGGKITGILEQMGVPLEKILDCPIGIEESWFVREVRATEIDRRTFIFVGRDERRKGIVELNTAVRLLPWSLRERARFHFIGPIDEGSRLDDPQVTYHGPIREEGRIRRLMRDADILLCTSYSEGMPTVIMEGMASGLAILATDVGAISQQVNMNGWLLPGPDPAAIGAAMSEAIRMSANGLDAKKRLSLAKAREYFIWEHVIERKLALLSGLVDRTRAHPDIKA